MLVQHRTAPLVGGGALGRPLQDRRDGAAPLDRVALAQHLVAAAPRDVKEPDFVVAAGDVCERGLHGWASDA